MGVFETELFLEFWKTLRCLWFYGTKTYHKVLTHPSHYKPFVWTPLEGVYTLHRLSSLLLDHFHKELCLCFSVCVIKKIYTSRKGFGLQEVRSGFP